jgi:hypothetical protein
LLIAGLKLTKNLPHLFFDLLARKVKPRKSKPVRDVHETTSVYRAPKFGV